MRNVMLVSSFVLLLGCSAASNEPTLVSSALSANASNGRMLYQAQCASCHGENLKGGLGSNLVDNVWQYGGGDSEILNVISTGITDAGMPAFGDMLNSSDMNDVLAFMRDAQNLKTTPAVDHVPSVNNKVKIEDWITGLDEPWGFVFTAPDHAIVTEKSGNLRVIQNGTLLEAPVAGTPTVTHRGQGGLLDVALDPDYSNNGWVYLAYSDPASGKKAMTKIVRGRINDMHWTDQDTLFEAHPEHYVNSRVHFGSRITFDKDGYLYFSIGDRGKKSQAQDLTRPNGKIHRIYKDGRIPTDNPYVGQAGVYESIYAYGNRNPQGLIIHPATGVLWETEHGPKGGDELNAIRKGVNYGWPKISYGRNYNGSELTPHTSLPGMAQPASHWTPSIAVCGLDVYAGDVFPEWQGRLLAGSLRNQSLRLIDVSGETYKSEMILLEGQGRIRDVTTGPDGYIYVALPSKIIRLVSKG